MLQAHVRLIIAGVVAILLTGCLTQAYTPTEDVFPTQNEPAAEVSTQVTIANSTDVQMVKFHAESMNGSFKPRTQKIAVGPGERVSVKLPDSNARLTVTLSYEGRTYDISAEITGSPGDQFEWEITETMWVRPEEAISNDSPFDGSYGYLDESYGYFDTYGYLDDTYGYMGQGT